MSTLKELQGKIISLKKTQKITSAMKMISTTKFNRYLPFMVQAKSYRKSLLKVAENLKSHLKESPHPLSQEKLQVKNIRIITITSDRGLCGSFNSYISKQTLQLLNEKSDQKVSGSFFGKKAYDFFSSKKMKEITSFQEMRLENFPTSDEKEENIPSDLPSQKETAVVAEKLMQDFLSNKVDEVYLSYNFFYSTISQKPTLEKLLPFHIELDDQKKTESHVTLFEPNVKDLTNGLLRLFVCQKIYFALISSLVGEHAARMTAMDNASKNCDDLIDKFTLEKNRARQAAITTELVEIISGSESL